MASDRQNSNKTPARPIRVEDELWDAFARWAGPRRRTAVLVEFMKWYSHQPHAKPPKRPERTPSDNP